MEEARNCAAPAFSCDITRPFQWDRFTCACEGLIRAGIKPEAITIWLPQVCIGRMKAKELRELVGSDWVLDAVAGGQSFCSQ